MKFIIFTRNTLKSLSLSVKKYYIPLGFSTLLFFILISMNQMTTGPNHTVVSNHLERLAMVSVLGFFITLCIQLFFERSLDISKIYKIIAYALATFFLVVIYFYMLKDINKISISMYIGTLFASLLGLFFAPHIKDSEFIEIYTIKFTARFFITAVYSLALFLGVSAIFLTLNKLLNLPVDWKTYYYTWLFVVTIFAPVFILGDFPANNPSLASYEYPSFLKILILYIVMPLSTIYLLILYVYFAKIIVSWTWPIGLVSHLVAWFSILCVGVLFVTEPIKDNGWINKFKVYLPKLLLPLLVMMFVSMGIRIKQYGVTENRYYILLLGIWVFLAMIYFIFRKQINNVLLPLSLALLCILSVFGPLSSFNISKWSQTNRLKVILQRNNMISKGKIIGRNNLALGDQKEIYEILYYFKTNHALSDIAYLDPGFKLSDMPKVSGFEYDHAYFLGDKNLNYYTAHTSRSIDIKNFSYLFNIDGGFNGFSEDGLSIKYNNTDGGLDISIDNKKVYHVNFTKYLSQLYEQFPEGESLSDNAMIFDDENERVKVRFVFSYLTGSLNTDDHISFRNSDFMLLLEVK